MSGTLCRILRAKCIIMQRTHSFEVVRSFYRQRVLVALHSESSGHHYLASGNCASWRDLFQVVVPDFSPISLHNLFCATGDGFRTQVSCFLLLGLPVVHFYTLGCVIFCLDFSAFFFFSLFPCRVFFLYLFIYLFRTLCITNVGLVYTYECNSLVLSNLFFNFKY